MISLNPRDLFLVSLEKSGTMMKNIVFECAGKEHEKNSRQLREAGKGTETVL